MVALPYQTAWTWLHMERETTPRKTALPWPPYRLSLGDPTPAFVAPATPTLPCGPRWPLTSSQAGVWEMQVGWGQPGFDSVALFACRHRSLTACGHRRLWEKEEMSCQPEPGRTGQDWECTMHTNGSDRTWLGDEHTSHTHTLSLSLLLTHTHMCSHSLAHSRSLIHTYALTRIQSYTYYIYSLTH